MYTFRCHSIDFRISFFLVKILQLFVSLHNRYLFSCCFYPFFFPVLIMVSLDIFCVMLICLWFMLSLGLWFCMFYQIWKIYWNYFLKYFFLHLPWLCPLFLGHQLHIIWKLLVLSHSWLRLSICLSYFFLCIFNLDSFYSYVLILMNHFLLQGLISVSRSIQLILNFGYYILKSRSLVLYYYLPFLSLYLHLLKSLSIFIVAISKSLLVIPSPL